MHVKKEDQVFVLSGKDRGKTGRVVKVFPASGKVLVENVNVLKKHIRPNPAKNIQGGILPEAAPIPLSKVQVICKECSEHARVGFKTHEDGKKVRVCKKCGAELD
ncbi:MAG: 50S ribosomal protein L24 [Acidobacteria bacterium]|nr:50S ribosomal protein L24 [Acidobacteriota bacterium]